MAHERQTKLPPHQGPMITHIAQLPDGFTAEFRWHPTSGLEVLWEPDIPHRRTPAFLAAYAAERDAFTQRIAASLGKRIMTVDTDGRRIAISSVIVPPTKQ